MFICDGARLWGEVSWNSARGGILGWREGVFEFTMYGGRGLDYRQVVEREWGMIRLR